MFAYAVENRLRRWFTGDVHIKFMTINIPQKAAQILRTLNAAGYEAYVVGGCVRDSILNRVPGDWDITTSGAGEGTFSQNRGHRDPAWNRNSDDG